MTSPATQIAALAPGLDTAYPAPDAHIEAVEWSVWFAGRQPGRALMVLAIILAAAMAGFTLFQNLLPAVAAATMLVASVSEFLLPVRYRLTPEAAESRNLFSWRRIEWRDVRRAYPLGDGIKLSPLESGGQREAFRGVLLRGGDPDQVSAAIRGWVPAGCSLDE